VRYKFGYAPEVQEELVDAITYYLSWHPASNPKDFLKLAVQAFNVPCDFPEAMPRRELPDDKSIYRQVLVWRFVFLYRIDERVKTLVVDRIYHERRSQ